MVFTSRAEVSDNLVLPFICFSGYVRIFSTAWQPIERPVARVLQAEPHVIPATLYAKHDAWIFSGFFWNVLYKVLPLFWLYLFSVEVPRVCGSTGTRSFLKIYFLDEQRFITWIACASRLTLLSQLFHKPDTLASIPPIPAIRTYNFRPRIPYRTMLRGIVPTR